VTGDSGIVTGIPVNVTGDDSGIVTDIPANVTETSYDVGPTVYDTGTVLRMDTPQACSLTVFLQEPRWPLQIPPPVATPNSPRQDARIMTARG